MSTFETIEISLCEGCLFVIANGEYGGDEDDGTARAETIARVAEQDGRYRWHDVHVACGSDDNECDHGFRAATCGACSEYIAGSIHDGVILLRAS